MLSLVHLLTFSPFHQIIFIFSIVYAYLFLVKRQTINLPPGPWGFPILGHLPLLGLYPHETLLKWTRTYGPIIFIRLGSYPSIVLNDVKSIKEAFSQNSFSGRGIVKPYFEASGHKGLLFCEGPPVMEQRQFITKLLKEFASGGKMEEKINFELSHLLHHLEKEGQGWNGLSTKYLFSSYTVRSLFNILCGERLEPNDPKIEEIKKCVSEGTSVQDTFLTKMSVFLSWSDLYFLRGVTGYNDKVKGLTKVYDLMAERIAHKKLTWVYGKPRDFTDVYLDKIQETTDESSSFHEKNEFQPKSTGDMFLAALDTVNAMLEWLLYYMALCPDIQRRFQDEIDIVIGPCGTPSLDHRAEMIFGTAVIHELLRITAISPLGLYHRTMENVKYRDFDVPKGTMVISNIYAAHHDPNVWGKDHDLFKPQRFIDIQGQITNTDKLITFSSGKRVCLGENVARNILFLYTVGIFQNFKVVFGGEKIQIVKPISGLNMAPEAFTVRFEKKK